MSSDWFGEDGTNGTCTVANGSPNVTFTAANLLSNNAATKGDGFKGPDGEVYGISAVTAENAITLAANYKGIDGAAQPFAIIPLLGGRSVALGKMVAGLLNSSSYSALAAVTPNPGDFVQCVGIAPVVYSNRTPLQVAFSLLGAITEENVASAATTDIGAGTSPKKSITGASTITSLGTVPNAVRIWRAASNPSSQMNNGVANVMPGGGNLQLKQNDIGLSFSDGQATPVWRHFIQRAHGGAAIFTGVTGSGNDVGSIGPTLSSPSITGALPVTNNINNQAAVTLTNNNGGNSAYTSFVANNGTSSVLLGIFGTGWVTAGLNRADGAFISAGGSGGLSILTSVSQPIYFASAVTENGRFGTDGSFLVGTTTNGGWSGNAKTASQASIGWTNSIYNTAASGGGGAAVIRVDNAAPQMIGFFFGAGTEVGSVTTNGTTISLNGTSGRALKMNAVALDASQVIANSKMYRGKWVHRPDEEWIGGIADEMAEQVPEGYRPSPTPDLAPHQDGYIPDQFDYSKYVPYLIAEAKRAQVAEQDALTRIASLEARLAAASL